MFRSLERSEVVLLLAVSFFTLTGVVSYGLLDHGTTGVTDAPSHAVGPISGGTPSSDAAAWFQSVRQHCNPVEVETYLKWQPAPPSPDGDMHKAACYALAGRIDRAREVIEGLDPDVRYRAAGVVFEAGHPAADAGDDVAAGPLMELVVEYWPNHYMALYHAGAAAFEREDYAASERYLTRFLQEYHPDDGWSRNARSMLEALRR